MSYQPNLPSPATLSGSEPGSHSTITPAVQHYLVQHGLQRRKRPSRCVGTSVVERAKLVGNNFRAVNVGESAKAHLGDVYNITTPAAEEKKSRRKCLRAFRTTRYEQHKDFNPKRAPETCQWVIEHEQFQHWHNSVHNDLLWISADPGCGKSVLSKYLVDEWLPANGYRNVCYFFFKENSEQSRLDMAVSAVLHQFFVKQPHLVKAYAMAHWEKMGKSIAQSVQSMWQILMEATSDPAVNGRTVCVLDALDECSEKHLRQLIEYLCQFLHSDMNSASLKSNIKFLVTSRPYENVQRPFEKATRAFPEIRLRGEDENEQIRNEINLVIDAHVAELADKYHLSNKTRVRLRTNLYGMEHRTYLWLYLTIDHLHKALHDSLSPDDVKFDFLPRDVEEAYELMLGRVHENQRSIVRRIFKLMLAARRPLTTQELTIALAVLDGRINDNDFFDTLQRDTQHLEQRVRQWCGLFVFLNDSKLYFIHQTAKEFLLSKKMSNKPDNKSWKPSLEPGECEIEMARFVIGYLGMQRFTVQDNTPLVVVANAVNVVEEPDLFRYSATWWASHLEAGCRSTTGSVLVGQAAKLCMGQRMLEGWFRYRWSDRYEVLKRSKSKPDQFVAVTVGSLQVVKHLRQLDRLDPEAKDSRGDILLFWAVRAGNPELLRWLSDEALQRNAATSSVFYKGAEQAYLGATWLLLNKKGPLHLRARQHTGKTLLHIACQNGRLDLVKVLLDTGANVNSRVHGTHMTSLMIAAKEGFEGIVRLLLESFASLNKTDKHGHTALDYALINKNDTISSLLRARGGKSTHDHDDDDTLSDGWEVIEEGEDLLDSTCEFIKVAGGGCSVTKDYFSDPSV